MKLLLTLWGPGLCCMSSSIFSSLYGSDEEIYDKIREMPDHVADAMNLVLDYFEGKQMANDWTGIQVFSLHTPAILHLFIAFSLANIF